MNDKWYRHIIERELLKLVWLLFYVFILYVVKPHPILPYLLQLLQLNLLLKHH